MSTLLSESQISAQRVPAGDVDQVVDYCTICYENEIQVGTGPVTDTITVEFDCKHRFCLECARFDLSSHIQNNKLDKLQCLQHECGQKITTAQLERIFRDTEPEVLDKFLRFRQK